MEHSRTSRRQLRRNTSSSISQGTPDFGCTQSSPHPGPICPSGILSNRLGRRSRRGIAAVVSLQFLVVFAVMGASFALVSDMEVKKADNFRAAAEARLAAESGLGLCTYILSGTDMSSNPRGEELLYNIGSHMAAELSGSISQSSDVFEADDSELSIPNISLGDRQGFRARISMLSEVEFRLVVVGCAYAGDGTQGTAAEYTVSMDFGLSHNPAFDYGLIVKGPITAGFGFEFLGVDDPADASLYSAASGTAITVLGGHIDGDVDTVQIDAEVDIDATVGGQIRENSPARELPQIDRTVFEPFATTIVDASTDTSCGIFRNIRIKAGTNPVFGDVAIEGVMYVEAPNHVQFGNNVKITGVIVTDDPGEGACPETHKIEFVNNLNLHGVDHLPDRPEFDELRLLTGAAFLAKGFTLDFKNNFTCVGGVMAAESIHVKNNLSCTLFGTIIVYGEAGIEFKNNTLINVDRSAYCGVPAGFVPEEGDGQIVPVPNTYAEGAIDG